MKEGRKNRREGEEGGIGKRGEERGKCEKRVKTKG